MLSMIHTLSLRCSIGVGQSVSRICCNESALWPYHTRNRKVTWREEVEVIE
jgi:hypothetical protein